jgi:hypothetical protein
MKNKINYILPLLILIVVTLSKITFANEPKKAENFKLKRLQR